MKKLFLVFFVAIGLSFGTNVLAQQTLGGITINSTKQEVRVIGLDQQPPAGYKKYYLVFISDGESQYVHLSETPTMGANVLDMAFICPATEQFQVRLTRVSDNTTSFTAEAVNAKRKLSWDEAVARIE